MITLPLIMGIFTMPVLATDNTLVSINPSSQTVSAGETFAVTVSCVPGQSMKSFELQLSYNSSLIHANSVTEGSIFTGYTTFFNAGTINNTAGTITNVYDLILGDGMVSGSGTLVSISFTAQLLSGTSNVTLSDVGVTNETTYLPVFVSNGNVTLREYTLTITTSGSGSVTKNPSRSTYTYGEVVQLTAVPSTGYSFVNWSGNLSGSSNPATITMISNKTVIAYFSDNISPQILNVSIRSSSPLDTNSSFGWVNISCNITDNVAVNAVYLNVTDPHGSWHNVSMTALNSTRFYYNSSTLFSDSGNHTYFVWVNDTSGNSNRSGNYNFSMVPNGDMNSDGTCSILDLVLVSNHYGETGISGWIREDVDNNGFVQVFDFVLIANEYGESWWA
ncbi:MAG: cohesin domain-containing protein [Euryarchaeota archaeon]|nr:cohesin domain-containing protein [Euryarchaeota archaeon]